MLKLTQALGVDDVCRAVPDGAGDGVRENGSGETGGFRCFQNNRG